MLPEPIKHPSTTGLMQIEGCHLGKAEGSPTLHIVPAETQNQAPGGFPKQSSAAQGIKPGISGVFTQSSRWEKTSTIIESNP